MDEIEMRFALVSDQLRQGVPVEYAIDVALQAVEFVINGKPRDEPHSCLSAQAQVRADADWVKGKFGNPDGWRAEAGKAVPA